MSYIIRQKFNIAELVEIAASRPMVLICEPDDCLAALYGHYLSAHNFDVKHCPHLGELRSAWQSTNPRLLLVNAEAAGSTNFSKEFPGLSVVTVGYNLTANRVKALLNAGVSGHIDRRLSRPEDVAVIIKTLLSYH